jgi:7-cyano-7-deazaguanine synthase in queuosine biosynthesis
MMAVNTIRAHLGPLDPLPQAAAGKRTVDLSSGLRTLGFGLGRAMVDVARLGMAPTEIAVDLLILAGLVYAADTRLPRTLAQDSWSREIALELPVSDPARWTTATPLLRRMLRFLSGDIWQLTFRPRPTALAQLAPSRPLQPPAYDGVCLFSGGLDSLVGAVDLFAAGRRPLLVSHASEGATSAAQNGVMELLLRRFNAAKRLRFWIAFPNRLLDPAGSKEDSTRSRSFLFFAAAAFAASSFFAGEIAITVPENGLISLNVPLDPLRLSSLSTRTTHPFYIARWNELLQALAIPGRLVTPYQFKTKGQMLAECIDQELLRATLARSMSCSSPTKGRWAGRPTEHCGYCVPCLIRRASIEAAFGVDPTSYACADLRVGTRNTNTAEGKQIRSFQLACDRLRSRPEIAAALIHKSGPLSERLDDLEQLADVYRRGMAEVAAGLAGVTARPA